MATSGSGGVLAALDYSKTQWYHYRAMIIFGMGLFTDAYDLFISLLSKLLGRICYHVSSSPKPGVHLSVVTTVNSVALCGTLLGRLFFGFLGDRLGHKNIYGLSLVIMALCSMASDLAFGSSTKSRSPRPLQPRSPPRRTSPLRQTSWPPPNYGTSLHAAFAVALGLP